MGTGSAPVSYTLTECRITVMLSHKGISELLYHNIHRGSNFQSFLLIPESGYDPEINGPKPFVIPVSPLRRAEDRVRSGDIWFTKPMLYQLSYFGIYISYSFRQFLSTADRVRCRLGRLSISVSRCSLCPVANSQGFLTLILSLL